MVFEADEGRWYCVGQEINYDNDNDNDNKYVVVEIYDGDDTFKIGIGEKSLWLPKKGLREVFEKIFDFKKSSKR